mgnify:CR=1 FL=1
MWEENLGPWPANVSPVMKCLEAVEASDLYLLFIGTKAGTYYPDAQRTVTHMEFIKAFDKGKTILVFADTRVKSLFFGAVKQWVEAFVEQQLLESGKFPSPDDMVAALRLNDDVPKEIDPYVWYFLYDMTVRNVYVDDLSLGVNIDWKEYFSDLLRRGSMLLPLQDSIIENGMRLEQYDDAFSALADMISHVRLSGMHDARKFVKVIVDRMSGGVIQHRYGPFLSETVGAFGPCIGATLYVNDGDRMNFVAKAGDAVGEPCFKLDDQSSYVALTYNWNTDVVHFKESKHMFYCCLKSGKHVLTLHFPSAPGWDNRKYMLYQDSVNDAILNKNPYLVELIKMVLGGLRQ